MSSKMAESMSNTTAWKRQLAVETMLRKAGGLTGGQGFHPVPEIFQRQADAVAALRKLVLEKDYREAQIGVFAQEIGDGGIRNFVVDTYAGFALNNSPNFNPHTFAAFKQEAKTDCSLFTQPTQKGKGKEKGSTTDPGTLDHLYEVLLEDRPCWLYFDLEYSRKTNPDLDPLLAMDAFRKTLAAFFADALQTKLDLSGMIELDSTTPEKFSKHVLVQRFCRQDDSHPECLAFANNAQAGLLVSEFIAYARARRDTVGSMSQHLFVLAPPSARDKTGDPPREVTLIDDSVYSRNRCFRLLFHKKFGKQAALQVSRDSIVKAFGRSEYPPLQLLRTMASYVPEGTCVFNHAMIPQDFGHALLKGVRLSDGSERQSMDNSADPSTGACKVDPLMHNGLLQFLVEKWNSVRDLNEPTVGHPAGVRPTSVQSVVKMGDRYLCVSLNHNRFCFCQGRSHVSNSVYMVVDPLNAVFCQKCHDSDCRHFRSPEFPIPPWLLQSEEEDALWEQVPPLPTSSSATVKRDVEDVSRQTLRPDLQVKEEDMDAVGQDVVQLQTLGRTDADIATEVSELQVKEDNSDPDDRWIAMLEEYDAAQSMAEQYEKDSDPDAAEKRSRSVGERAEGLPSSSSSSSSDSSGSSSSSSATEPATESQLASQSLQGKTLCADMHGAESATDKDINADAQVFASMLTNEQLARIERNWQMALERKRLREDSNRQDNLKTSSQDDMSSPVSAATDEILRSVATPMNTVPAHASAASSQGNDDMTLLTPPALGKRKHSEESVAGASAKASKPNQHTMLKPVGHC